MFARIACIALLAGALLAAAPAAAMKDEDGLTGLWGICWGMSVAEAIALFGRSEQVQRTKISVSGCYVRYAILIRLLNEDWSIWMCEAPDAAVVAALNFESKSGHTRHFDSFLEAFTEAYGPAHSYWHTFHNANWNKTVQYDWYFPEMRVSLVSRPTGSSCATSRPPSGWSTDPASASSRPSISGATRCLNVNSLTRPRF